MSGSKSETTADEPDFAHVAKLLRKYSAPQVAALLKKDPNHHERNLRAVLSNNLNLILAALDIAAAGRRCLICGGRVDLGDAIKPTVRIGR